MSIGFSFCKYYEFLFEGKLIIMIIVQLIDDISTRDDPVFTYSSNRIKFHPLFQTLILYFVIVQ